jgi:RNA polymerase sigma factor (sigma-70 family)
MPEDDGPLEPQADPLGELVQAASTGDARATRRLLEALSKPVLRVVKTALGPSHADVEDAAQESLIAFVRALPAFRSECSAVHYAARIAVRTAMAWKRRARSGQREELSGSEDEAAPDSDLEAQREATQRRRVLSNLMQELPEVQAETLALRIVLGYSMQEVADATGAPLNTVRSRLRLAKEALRRRIEATPALADALEP